MAIMKMRHRSGIKQQDLQYVVKKNLNNFMKSFLSSRLAHMTVAWFQKIALPVHCPSAISERKSQLKYQLGIWQDINKLAENKPTGNISSARIDLLSDGTCHPTSDCLGTILFIHSFHSSMNNYFQQFRSNPNWSPKNSEILWLLR